MTRCLDESELQGYFDGELSIERMERVTSHLAACVTCAAAAREVEEETALLTTALAAEFESSVPTQQLRQRIDRAILGERVEFARTTEKRSTLAAFFSGLLNFGTQRTLGYASLAVLIAFGAMIGFLNLRTEPSIPEDQAVVSTPSTPIAVPTDTVAVENPDKELKYVADPVIVNASDDGSPRDDRKRRSKASAPPVPAPVKLLPGERSYLQAIARLDSTIESNKRAMRPSLRAEYERNLAVVDRAIAATRSAAKSNPNDPDAADFMFAAYQSKVDLLNTIADARLSGGPRD